MKDSKNHISVEDVEVLLRQELDEDRVKWTLYEHVATHVLLINRPLRRGVYLSITLDVDNAKVYVDKAYASNSSAYHRSLLEKGFYRLRQNAYYGNTFFDSLLRSNYKVKLSKQFVIDAIAHLH